MFETPILAIIFLIASSLMTGLSCSIQRLGKSQAENLSKKGFAKWLFKKSKRDPLSYAITITKNILLICYTITALDYAFTVLSQELTTLRFSLAALIVLCISVISDYLFRAISLFRPKTYFKLTSQICSFFILLFWPLSLGFFKILHAIRPPLRERTSIRIKDKILEILHDAEFAPYLEPNDQKLILSVVSFKERIAREVMVPRIDMYTLDANTSVKEAAEGFLEEGYSRIPIWKDNVDNIVGTLYYKDLFTLILNHPNDSKELEAPIEKLIKPIVYTPETKKISQLLQEFRSKQIHLAIVVDEYGGTEGIVTIEDILEELVGEIADEYDYDEEALYSILPSGGWIVDAKMTIIDIEDELGIKIPQSPEYDTIGGFIFHKAGTIPSKGWRLHQDHFDLEVLSSSERTLEKIRVTPH